MKTPIYLLTIILSLFFFSSSGQDSNNFRNEKVPMIGDRAPSFSAETTKGTLTFPDDYFGKWKILFSHPGDFTPVCTTEIIELAQMQDTFDKLNTRIAVLSTDGLPSHLEWIKSMESISYKENPPVNINFPLISDRSLEISKKYGMIHPESSTTRDVRGVFIIDPDDKIQSIIFYPMTTGRNMNEIVRVLIALQKAEAENVMTPANWVPGEDVLLHSPKNLKDAEKQKTGSDTLQYSMLWYLWFKKDK